MTNTDAEALAAIQSHHQLLQDELRARIATLDLAVAAGRAHQQATAALVTYLADEVLPHAAAEEQTIYRAAQQHAELAGTVDEMITEHRALVAAAGRLASAADAIGAAEQARQIASLFGTHVAKEKEILLPALATDGPPGPASQDGQPGQPGLVTLLREMHEQTQAARQPAVPATGPGSGPASGPTSTDPLARVLSLLLTATAELARADQGDRACQLAAAAWAALHETRPELAGRVTAALHGLARRVPGQPAGAEAARAQTAGPETAGLVAAGSETAGAETAGAETAGAQAAGAKTAGAVGAETAGSEAGGSRQSAKPSSELDVRDLPPAQRHESIFASYADLAPGSAFILINDHDPKPLYYQFEAEHSGEFSWDYLQAGPEEWRVRIGRA